MGSSLSTRHEYTEIFCNSEAGKLIAEVFFRELQFISGESLANKVVVRNHGMNSRVKSQDVLGVQTENLSESFNDRIVLHLARNGLYHQLPEFLFHPISLSSPDMSNNEIVAAIRANRKKEEKTIRFFSPFDTEIFKDGVRIFGRSLNLFNNPYTDNILQKVSSLFYTESVPLTQEEKYRLFLFLYRSDRFKEDLPTLEKVIYVILHIHIALKYKYHRTKDLPYGALGECWLGRDAGLSGTIISELDDVEAKLCFEKNIENETFLKEKIAAVRFILSFFILSSRHIDVIYTVSSNTEFILNRNYLGYDTNL